MGVVQKTCEEVWWGRICSSTGSCSGNAAPECWRRMVLPRLQRVGGNYSWLSFKFCRIMGRSCSSFGDLKKRGGVGGGGGGIPGMLQREGEESEEELDSSSDHTASKDSFETCYESIFADLTPESLPEFVNVRELLSDIESELGEQACQLQFDPLVANSELPEEVNVRELLAEIQEELDEPYFDKFFSTCNEDSSGASQVKRYHNNQASTSNADIVTSEEEEGTSFRVSPRNDNKAADTS